MPENFKDELLRPWDLCGPGLIIEDATFEGCSIVGPSILFLEGSNLIGNTVEGTNVNDVLWIIPPTKTMLLGVIGARNCTFRNCTFKGIGFAVREDEVHTFWAGLTQGNP